MTDIRRATAEDAQALLPLVEQYWQFENVPGFDGEQVVVQLRRLLSEGHLGAGWIALADASVAGYLLAVYVFSLEHRGITAEIDEFFVLASRRGRGIGEALLQAAEQEFCRAGCTSVSLQLGRQNDAARAFYRQHGYGERAGFELLDKMLVGQTGTGARENR